MALPELKQRHLHLPDLVLEQLEASVFALCICFLGGSGILVKKVSKCGSWKLSHLTFHGWMAWI